MRRDFEDSNKVQRDFNNDVLDGLARQEGDMQEAQDRLEDVEGRLDRQVHKVRRLEMQTTPATGLEEYLKQEVKDADKNVSKDDKGMPLSEDDIALFTRYGKGPYND